MDEHTARWRHRHMRCTVCLWRGPWADAEDAPKVKPKHLEPHEQALQDAYEEKEKNATLVGQPHAPSCPECGHHLLFIMKKKLGGKHLAHTTAQPPQRAALHVHPPPHPHRQPHRGHQQDHVPGA